MRTVPPMDCDSDAARLVELAHGLWTTQAMLAAVELGVVDALAAGGPQDADDLARQLTCHAGALHRLLRGLAALGLCHQVDDARYALTAAGAQLAQGHPQSLKAWVLLAGRRSWGMWAGLSDAVRTGRPTAWRGGDSDRFQRLQHDPAEAAEVHLAMAALTRQVAPAVAARVAPLLPGVATVVDVGGGNGALLCAVLLAAPAARGIVLDRAHAAAQAQAQFTQAALGPRAGFAAGDFFERVPPADLVLMKSVLHDWDDAACAQLLARSAAALLPGGVIAIVERLAPDRVDGSPAHRHTCRSDLNMLVATGGRERRLTEFEALLSAAGLRIDAVLPAALDFAIVVARRAAGEAG